MKKLLLITVSLLLASLSNAQDYNVPETAKGPIIPQDKGYLVGEINNNLYWVTDGLYNAMFLVYDKGVVMVDAPPTIGENLLLAVKDVTAKPITHLVYTHSHTDHIGAAGIFPKGIEIVAQEATKKSLVDRNDSRRPIPTKTFKDNHTLKLGNQVLQLDYYGKNHTDGNIFVFAPKQKVLMLVDIVYPGWVPFKNLGVAEDVPAYIKAHDQALAYDFNTFVAGHVTRLGNRGDVEISKTFVEDLKKTCGEAFTKVSFEESAKETGYYDKWKMYDTYLSKVVDIATKEMHKKWKGKLGGIDTYLRDDVWKMCESYNIDF